MRPLQMARLGAGVTHVDGAQAALGVGKVAPGVVSNHEALVGSHAELAAELEQWHANQRSDQAAAF